MFSFCQLSVEARVPRQTVNRSPNLLLLLTHTHCRTIQTEDVYDLYEILCIEAQF